MPQALYPPARPQSIGEVLDSGFAIFRRSLWRCLPYGFLGVIGYQLPHVHDLLAGRPFRQLAPSDPIWWVDYLIGFVISIFFYGALLFRQRALAAGEPAVAAVELRGALRCLPALLLMLILFAVGLMIGTALLIVPALYLAVAWIFAAASLLLENLGPFEALAYSQRLVHGYWWRTSLIFSVMGAVLVAVYASIGVVVGIVFAFTGMADLAVVTAVSAAASTVIAAVGTPFWSALLLAAYGELRVRREGLDLERRAAAALAS
jgi:peptidoglycan/LPS O-acetylase OafA/YrhL